MRDDSWILQVSYLPFVSFLLCLTSSTLIDISIYSSWRQSVSSIPFNLHSLYHHPHKQMTTHSQAFIQIQNIALPATPPSQSLLGLFTPSSSSTTKSFQSGTVGGQIIYLTGTAILKTQSTSLITTPGNGDKIAEGSLRFRYLSRRRSNGREA